MHSDWFIDCAIYVLCEDHGTHKWFIHANYKLYRWNTDFRVVYSLHPEQEGTNDSETIENHNKTGQNALQNDG